MDAEGRAGGMERVWHSGDPIALDITAFVVGSDVNGIRELHAEAGMSSGKDLDYVADAIPGFVEANAGKGGFDLLLDAEEIDEFFLAHGLAVSTLTQDDLVRLRDEYGVAPGALPQVLEESAAPKGP